MAGDPPRPCEGIALRPGAALKLRALGGRLLKRAVELRVANVSARGSCELLSLGSAPEGIFASASEGPFG
jgi:hypothetical protein